jgi:cell division protein FtsB
MSTGVEAQGEATVVSTHFPPRTFVVATAVLTVVFVLLAIAACGTAKPSQAHASTVVAYTSTAGVLLRPLADPRAEIEALVTGPALRERVRQNLGLTAQGLAAYTVGCTDRRSGSLQFVITVTGPDKVMAASISQAAAAVLVEMRREAQRASLRRAEQILRGEIPRVSRNDRPLLRQRLRDLRGLEQTVTGDLTVVT